MKVFSGNWEDFYLLNRFAGCEHFTCFLEVRRCGWNGILEYLFNYSNCLSLAMITAVTPNRGYFGSFMILLRKISILAEATQSVFRN